MLLLPVLEAADGQGDLLLGPGGHLQEFFLERFQLFVERAFCFVHRCASPAGRPRFIRTGR